MDDRFTQRLLPTKNKATLNGTIDNLQVLTFWEARKGGVTGVGYFCDSSGASFLKCLFVFLRIWNLVLQASSVRVQREFPAIARGSSTGEQTFRRLNKLQGLTFFRDISGHFSNLSYGFHFGFTNFSGQLRSAMQRCHHMILWRIWGIFGGPSSLGEQQDEIHHKIHNFQGISLTYIY